MTTLALCSSVTALTADSPYKAIIDRNVFGLKDPPPPPKPEDTSKPQPSRITLTGITTILGKKQALMKTPAGPAKPGEPAKSELSFILTIGQRESDIEVLEIDEIAGSVKVNNAGNVETLTFDKNGPKIPATPPPVVAGVPGLPGIPAPNPGAVASLPPPTGGPATVAPFSFPNSGIRTVPTTTRSLRTPGTSVNQTGLPGYAPGYTPTPGYGTGPGTVPGANTPGTVNVGSLLQSSSGTRLQPNWPPEDPTITGDQQAAILMLQHEASKGDPNAPPMPWIPGVNNPNNAPAQPVQQNNLQQQQNFQPRPPGMPAL